MKQGILDRAAERRDGPQVYDVGLVPPAETTLEQGGLAIRGNGRPLSCTNLSELVQPFKAATL